MEITVTRPEIDTEDKIEAELRRQGLYFLKLDVPAVENGSHWHDFSSTFYITEGTLYLSDVASGTIHEAGPGARVSVPEGTLHAERSETGYSILLGVTRDPATFAEPLNLPPEDL